MQKLLLSLVIFFIACENNVTRNDASKKISIGRVEMTVTDTDTLIEGNGIDSHVLYLINEKSDTFHIEYGKLGIIYTLFDLPPKALPLKDKEAVEKLLGRIAPAAEVRFSSFPDDDNLQNVFQDEFFMYDTINTIVVKLVQPKVIGRGKTGMYIPILPDSNAISIYAINLDSSSHQKAIQMFKSIRYK